VEAAQPFDPASCSPAPAPRQRPADSAPPGPDRCSILAAWDSAHPTPCPSGWPHRSSPGSPAARPPLPAAEYREVCSVAPPVLPKPPWLLWHWSRRASSPPALPVLFSTARFVI